MDYDDNDSQDHNLRLAGEEISKPSSFLRPYAFPKFDFDDSLPGHLRFDSLVETEAFLGDQSQEDNQWIQDFSRTNDVIEFNPSATESCSLSRRNNVWSEATSSESVEMLLNSVGQEEMVPEETLAEESNNCDELRCLAKQMEQIQKLIDVKNELVAGPIASTTEGGLQETFPGLDEGRELPKIEGTSQLLDTEVASRHLGAVSVAGTSMIDPSSFANDDNGGNMEREAKSSMDDTKFSGSKPLREDLLDSETQKPLSVPHLDSAGGKLESNTFETKRSTSSMNSQIDVQIFEHHVEDPAGPVVEIPPPLVSNASIGSPDDIDTNSGSIEESACIMSKDESQLLGLKTSVRGVSVIQSDQRHENNHSEEMPESSLGKHSEISASTFQTSLFSGEENQFPVCKTSTVINSAVGGCSDPAVLSSHVLVSDSKEACHAACVPEIERNDDVHSTISGNDSSGKLCEEMLVVKKFDAGTTGDHSTVIDSTSSCGQSLPDTRNVDPDVQTAISDQAIQSAADGRTIAAGVVVHGLQPGIYADVESENKINPASTGNWTEENGQPLGLRPSHTDEQQEIAKGISTDASLPSLKAFASKPTEVETVSKPKVGLTNEATGAMISNIAEQPTSIVDNDDAGMVKPFHAAKTDSFNCSLEESSVLASGKLVNNEVDTEEVPTESQCNNTSAQTSDQKAACDSPTTISSKELSQNEIRKLEEGKDVQSTAEDPGGKDTTPVDDSNFTFKVNSLSHVTDKGNGSNWSPVPCTVTCNSATVVEGNEPAPATTTTPSRSRRGPDTGRKPPRSASERKSRRGAGKGTMKEIIPEKSKGKDDKLSDVLLLPPGGNPHAKFPEMQPYVGVEPNNTMTDLNSSTKNSAAVPAATFQQPFTDMQQVQLRAQIFVYGSLIQGAAPEEPCMIAAFGPSDGGRSAWEPAWQAAVERVHNQKSISSSAESPMVSHSKAPEPVAKPFIQQNRLPPSPVSRASGKAVPAMLGSPTLPPPSPLWTMPTPSRDGLHASSLQRGLVMDFQPPLSPVHPYQNPPTRNFAVPSPWPSQGPFPGTWIPVTRISTSDASARGAPVCMTDTVKLTPARDSSGPSASAVMLATSSPLVPTTLFTGVSQPPETTKGTGSSEQYSADAKSKKRKKSPASSGLAQTPVISETLSGTVVPSFVMMPTSSLVAIPGTQTEPVVMSSASTPSLSVVVSEIRTAPVVASSVMTSTSSLVTDTTPAFPMRSMDMSESAGNLTPISSAEQLKRHDLDTGKLVASSDEGLSKVAEAKLQAEKAASFAAGAVSHSEGIWNQLAEQRKAGLTSEIEAKLASAAVAIAAAASVAKAAAAAAEVASSAALQAKLMADEALISVNIMKPVDGGEVSSGDANNVEKATPASILKANLGYTESTSILVAAKEAAKRRLEAASAASKQAENLDAIVKAAELAAEAVSQAGKIVAMGDPLLLSQLMRAGSGHSSKLPPASIELAVDVSDNDKGETSVRKGEDISLKESQNVRSHDRGVTVVTDRKATPSRQSSDGTLRNSSKVLDDHGTSIPVRSQDMDTPNAPKALEVPNRNKVRRQPDGVQIDQASHDEDGDKMDSSRENTIKAGCTVEVLKDGDGLKPGWFSARALTLEDGKVLVSYEDLLADDGSGNLKEWVSLEGDVDKAPRIRLPYPPTSVQVQGAKKRRRADIVDHAWAVGDNVDALINNCWREGILTEKNEKDITSFTVHFPADGETTVIKAWQLRPSRTWSNWKWIAWSTPGKHKISYLGDTPKQKRQKVAAPPLDSEGMGRSSGDINHDIGKPEESNPLALSASDKVFNIGKSSTEENKPTQRTLRTGLQKEGSTIYGLPKPGKKRKFMDVSKHFPADGNRKAKEIHDSTKISKPSMPQPTVPRGWRNASKVDSKEKQSARLKVGVSGSRKLPSVSSRTMPQMDTDQGADVAVDHENNAEKSIAMEHCSSSDAEEAAEGPGSSLSSDRFDGSSKKGSSSNSESERLSKRKVAPSSGRLTKIDEEKVYDGNPAKSAPDVVEPRRSNRRTQPTHRLLEGLQSAMVIPKMPAISHDKGPRTQNRSSSSKVRWV